MIEIGDIYKYNLNEEYVAVVIHITSLYEEYEQEVVTLQWINVGSHHLAPKSGDNTYKSVLAIERYFTKIA